MIAHAKIEAVTHLFENELIEEIKAIGRLKSYPENALVIDVGDNIVSIPILLGGSIRIMRQDENLNELLLYYLEFGDTCAMTLKCCFGKQKSKIIAIAEEPSTLLMIPIGKMDAWLAKYKSWRAFILESYDQRFNEMLEAIDTLAFQNMEGRLVKYLRDRAMVNGSPEIKTTHSQIANDLNSSRVVISRLMKRLERENIISQGRKSIQIKEFT